MKKTIVALVLASLMALTTASSVALAGASEQGRAHGLPHACSPDHANVVAHNKNCFGD
ncbi:MAG TPA: hypothetical protein VG370_20435 [Chloroflexota bacterium]|jgi:hypothetical protein|nr:hypothetical protein [Chloroflexota bacterium]